MIRQIAPQFFTTDLPSTLAYYRDKLGFNCLGAWQDPPVYAIVARDQAQSSEPHSQTAHPIARVDAHSFRKFTEPLKRPSVHTPRIQPSSSQPQLDATADPPYSAQAVDLPTLSAGELGPQRFPVSTCC